MLIYCWQHQVQTFSPVRTTSSQSKDSKKDLGMDSQSEAVNPSPRYECCICYDSTRERLGCDHSVCVDCLERMRKKGVKKFLGTIGEWNVPALKLALRCGFKEEGRISKAYQRDGIDRAMVMMGRE